jgi:hypothetical protein
MESPPSTGGLPSMPLNYINISRDNAVKKCGKNAVKILAKSLLLDIMFT